MINALRHASSILRTPLTQTIRRQCSTTTNTLPKKSAMRLPSMTETKVGMTVGATTGAIVGGFIGAQCSTDSYGRIGNPYGIVWGGWCGTLVGTLLGTFPVLLLPIAGVCAGAYAGVSFSRDVKEVKLPVQ